MRLPETGGRRRTAASGDGSTPGGGLDERVDDLGDIEGPILAFGGPYGNLEATRALVEAARRLGIPGHRTLCTGDTVAYAADPQGTVDLLRDWGCPIVRGNCEEALAADAEDCGCGFSEGSACATLSVQWFEASRRDLSQEAKRWMGSLPRRIAFRLGGRSLVAIHGGVEQVNRFVFASLPATEKAAELERAGSDGVIAGHAGLPFSQLVGDRLWHNPGAIGMPANDGTPRVWFSVLSAVRDGIRVVHHALEYDHATAAAKMRERGYPAEYAGCLGDGLWPSCDILPEEERALRGRAVVSGTLLWPSLATASTPAGAAGATSPGRR